MALSDDVHKLTTRARDASDRTPRARAYARRGATDAGRTKLTDWRVDVHWEDGSRSGRAAAPSSATRQRHPGLREAIRELTASWRLAPSSGSRG